ncbi:efflux RND transporter periplasmic adaptor subunit [Brytella acorum]|uniref:Efflux RND transporter periplasmic adaptor subunit n=1 Tax=Brytella acorum TaxID=2959299 RepID=A0AA35Y3H8_9PROT|nr:efflux RND transporter periplasmic adaptor subunit [Brytella acorum]MDF3624899.1 efflux RND transporter periplasmic adaptor subunit [Brytella acorum]CAI9120204.1 efflux RND transporter periplasmic adaptor subunit [Brytella acorum]
MRSISVRHQVSAGLLALILSAVLFAVIRSHKHPLPGVSVAMMHREGDAIVVTDDSPLLARLKVNAVELRRLPHNMSVPATVQAEPLRSITVKAPVTGHVIASALKPGDTVHRGDIVAEIASGDFAQASSDLDKAKAQLAFEERVVRRAQGVLNVGGAATKDLDSARNDYAQAEAEFRRTQQRLASMDARPDLAARGIVALVSPVDGVVGTNEMAVGEYVTDVTAEQMTLLDLSEVWVEAQVPEDLVSALKVGETAQANFDAFPDAPCFSPLLSLDPVLRAETRRTVARMACPNPDGHLRPNMFGDVVVSVPQPPQIVVPKSAILMNNDQMSVFVEVAPRSFSRRVVSVSYDEGDDVRVLSGLRPDDRIVSSGGILLNDGL